MRLLLQSFLRRSTIHYGLLIVLFLVLTSCEKEKLTPVTDQKSEVPSEIIDKLKKAGFDTSEGLRKFEDGYLVEYDIFLTEEKIDELITAANPMSNGRVEHYRTNHLVGATPRTLLVFMDPSFGTYMQNSFDAALARYNTLNLSLRFARTTNSALANIRILSFFENSTTLGFSAGFPSAGNPASPIRLNTFYYNNTSSRPDATTVIAHEIGHAVGFRHTDYMNRTFSCGTGGNEGGAGVGAVHLGGTPTTPSANSWMLACSNNTNRPFTSFDIVALRAAYPNSTAPSATVPVYRYWNSFYSDHFYTTNWAELGAGKNGYGLEGVGFFVHRSSVTGSVPIYRYYNGGSGDHFYTTNWGELGGGRNGYGYEGILGYAFPSSVSGTVPVYRYYNAGSGDHFYTTNWGELGGGRNGYGYEGVAFYTYQ